MKTFWQTTSIAAAGTPVLGSGPVPTWDSRLWLLAFPVAWVVIYASVWTQKDDTKFRALVEAGIFACDWGWYEHAEVALTEALRLRPGYVGGHNILGHVLYARGKYEASLAQYTEALRLEPGSSEAHFNLGFALQSKARYHEAEAHYVEALRLTPGLPDAHKNLGLVLYAQGRYEPAAAHLTESLRLNPGYVDARNNLGMILYRQRRYADARAHFAKSVRLDPVNVQAHYNLGLVFSRLGDYQAAKAEFAEAIRLEPGDPRPFNAGALMMATCPDAKFRDGEKALRYATRACELTQWKNPVILDTLAAAQAQAGDFDTATKSQRRAIELLTNEQLKDEYRSRLKLYEAKKPYREASPKAISSEARR